MLVLITGGGGRLGRELLPLLPGASAPTRADLDVTDPAQVDTAVAALTARARAQWEQAVVVHAAAYTDVRRAETSATHAGA